MNGDSKCFILGSGCWSSGGLLSWGLDLLSRSVYWVKLIPESETNDFGEWPTQRAVIFAGENA